MSAEEGFTFTLDQAGPILGDCSIGDSICINGACLTVTSFDAALGTFTVGLAPETLDRTNLGQAKVGDYVNCERAMAGHTRFGGHMVQVSGNRCISHQSEARVNAGSVAETNRRATSIPPPPSIP